MRILLVGDVMIGRLVNSVLNRQPPEYPWGDLLPLFESADLRVCNLECVLSDRGRPWSNPPKMFHFRSDARNIRVLEAAGLDMLSLANNHTLDYEEEALLDTLDALERAGIGSAGAGRNIEEARQPAVREACGLRVGLLAFTDNEPDWEAGGSKAGIWYVPVDEPDTRTEGMLELVQTAKAAVDFLIVSAHWGPNWGAAAPAEHVALARRIVDVGGDVVFGHSAHRFRGTEIYRQRPILYSTGDFLDDYAVDDTERNDHCFAFVVQMEEGRVEELHLYPTVISNCQVNLAKPGTAETIARRMEGLCAELGTASSWIPAENHLRILLE
jgi:poly-gamma-glutamate capsule biosynthesis protein CapA/YwtB (metallophosphatase superfamily)